ncbi:MAG: hypothetical protein CBC35_03650 [Planctomycetes bacterium TMED75]|nr:hypothetical protein [Planctomycetaceae bacterium]OUU94668.1 MAG: hypothetical protein CBC35_03650 [Planctomycetes bacterium TMED75]
MSWLTPLTGVLVAAFVVPPLLLLYFLKLRRVRREIPSTMLWRRSVEDVRANAPFQRIRYSVLLLLQLLILALLALALAQPQFEGTGSEHGRTVIAIDHSASMNATDSPDGRSRLELAKESAIARVQALHGGGIFSGGDEQIMVVAFADGAEVVAPFTDSSRQAIDAIRSVPPTDTRTTIKKAIELARVFTTSTDLESLGELGSGQDPAVLEVFSDGRISDLDEVALRTGEQIRYTVVGSATTANVGITQIAAERPWNRPNMMQVFAVIDNHGTEPIEVDVELRVDGAARAVTPQPITIPARTEATIPGTTLSGREQVVFVPFEQPRGALIEVRLLHEDDLVVDNTAQLVVPAPRALDVALVGEDSFLLQSLLEGMPLESLDVMTPAVYSTLIDSEQGAWDVVLFDGWTPEVLPRGQFLVFGSLEGISELAPFGAAERAFIRSAKDEHPIFRYVTLDDLFIWKMPKVTVDGDVEILAESIEGPTMVLVKRPGIELLWVAFDILDSTWWHQRSFANFIPNAIEFLAASGGALVEKSLLPGEPITMSLPVGSRSVEVLRPDGVVDEGFLGTDGRFSWGPVLQAGLHEVSWSAPGASKRSSVVVAVNMLDGLEGQIDSADELNLSVERITGTRRSRSALVSVWPWLLVAGLLILVLEWYVYHRRVG